MANTAAILDVVLRAQTSRATVELKKFSKELDKTSRQAKATDKSVSDTDKSFSKLGGSGGSVDKANRNMMLLKNTVSLVKFPALITGAGVAAQAVSALGAGAAGLVSALAPLSGLLAAYPALFGAFAQASGVLAVAGVDDLTTVVGGLNDKLDETSDDFKKLSPQAQEFARTMQAAKKPLLDIQKTVQEPLFEGLNDGLDAAVKNMPALKSVATDTASVMGDLAREAGRFAGREGFGRDFAKVGASNAQLLGRLGEAGLHFGDALRHVLVVSRPLIDFLGKGAVIFSEWIEGQAKAGRESGAMADFFDRTRKVISQLVQIGGSLGSVFFDIGKAARPLGEDILAELVHQAELLSTWTDNNQGKLRAYFDDAAGPLAQAGKLAKDLVGAFFDLANTSGLGGFIKQFRKDLLPALVEMTRTTTKQFGPVLIDSLTSITKLLTNFLGSSGVLTGFVKLIGQAADALNSLFESIPGLASAASSALAGFSIFRLLGLGKLTGAAAGGGILSTIGTKLGTTLGTTVSSAAGPVIAAGIGAAIAGIPVGHLVADSMQENAIDDPDLLLRALGGGDPEQLLNVMTVLTDGVGDQITKNVIRKWVESGEVSQEQGAVMIKALKDVKQQAAALDKVAAKAKGFGFAQQLVGEEGAMKPAINNILRLLETLPKGARDIAIKTMVKWAQAMEQNGELPKGTTNRLIKALEDKWGKLPGIAEKKGKQSHDNLDKWFKKNADSADKHGKDLATSFSTNMDKAGHALDKGGKKTEDFEKRSGSSFERAGTDTSEYADKVNRAGKDVGNTLERAGTDTSQFRAKSGTNFDAVGDKSGQMKTAVSNSVGSMAKAVGSGFKRIESATNKALAAFGVKSVAFAIGEGVAAGDTQNKQVGGVIVPGQGSGDKVHAMLEPGEVVLNRTAVAAMGGADRANSINRKIPRFAKGGKASKGTPQWDAMVAMANKFEAADEPYLLGGGHGGFLSSPAPVDCSGFVSAVLHAGGLLDGAPMVSGALASSWGQPGSGPLTVYANDGHTFMSLDGNFYGTSQSNPGGGAGLVEGGYDAGYISGFVKKTMDVAAGAIGGATQIARQVLKGPEGALKAIGQGALDKVRGAANKYIASKMPAGTLGGGDAEIGAPIKSLPGSLQGYNRVYERHQAPDYSGETMPANKIAQLAEWAGMPGVTMEQITRGESAGRPGSVGPVGDPGVGLWAITPPFANGLGYTGGSLSGDYEPEMRNPVLNAQIAAHMAAAAGGPNASIWHGSGSVTGWDLHYTGSMNQKGGIIQKLAEGGIVGAFDQMIDRVRTRDDAEERQDAIKNFLERVKAIKLAAKRMEEISKQRGILAEAVQWEGVGADKAELDDLGNLIPGSDTAHGHSQEVWLNKQLDALFELRNQLVMAGEILARKEAEVRKVLERARKHLKKVQKEVDKAQKEREHIQHKVDAVENEDDARDFLHWLHDEETGKAQPSRPLLEFIHDQLNKDNPAKGLGQVMDLVVAPEGPKRVVDALESGIIEKLDTKAASLHTAFEASRDSSEGLEWIQGIHGNLHDLFNKKNRPKPGILAGEIWEVQKRIKNLKPIPPEPDTPLEMLQVQEALAAATPTLSDDIAVQQDYVAYWTGEVSRLLGSGGSAADLASAYDAISSARDLIEQLRADQFTSASTPSLEELLGFQRGGVIPAFAEGGTMARTGWALVGEKGPEIVKLQRGDEVVPNAATTASYPKPTDWAYALPPKEVIEGFLSALRTASTRSEADLAQAQTRAAFPSSPEGIESSKGELSQQLTIMNTLLFHYGRLKEWLRAGLNSPWVPEANKENELRPEYIDLVGYNGQGGTVLDLQGQIEAVQEALAAPVSTSGQLELLESKMALAGLTETLNDDIYWQGRIVDYWETELASLKQSGAAPSLITQAASSLKGARDTLKGLEETTDTTEIDRLEANLALAGLTPTLADDIGWQQQIVNYWQGELERLQDIGAAPTLIGAAASSLTGARDALKGLKDTDASKELEQLESKFALAQLTETIDDDIKWQREIVDYWRDELARLQEIGASPGLIGSAAGSLKGAKDALAGLQEQKASKSTKLTNLEMKFALAQLTESLADDIKWQKEIVAYWAKELKRLKDKDAPPEQITAAAQSLLGARSTLEGLLPEDTTEDQKNDLLKELLQQANLRFAISQAQYGVLGAFAKGGVASSSGMYLVGENGPERAYLPQGTTVVPGTGEVQVVINGDIHQAAGDRRPPIQVTGAPEDIVRRGARGYGRRPAPGAVGR